VQAHLQRGGGRRLQERRLHSSLRLTSRGAPPLRSFDQPHPEMAVPQSDAGLPASGRKPEASGFRPEANPGAQRRQRTPREPQPPFGNPAAVNMVGAARTRVREWFACPAPHDAGPGFHPDCGQSAALRPHTGAACYDPAWTPIQIVRNLTFHREKVCRFPSCSPYFLPPRQVHRADGVPQFEHMPTDFSARSHCREHSADSIPRHCFLLAQPINPSACLARLSKRHARVFCRGRKGLAPRVHRTPCPAGRAVATSARAPA
jgi:hypothetical protein